jgi:diguanylate cyclase (GGDEF)-like protein
MRPADHFRSILVTGWACVVLASFSGAAAMAAPASPAELLKRADSIKTSDYSAFADLIKQLDGNAITLSTSQQLYLRYLKAWQLAYLGNYAAAIPELNTVMDATSDVTLRYRAGVTAVNMLAVASRYEEAYTRLNELLDLMPQVPERDAQSQGIAVAAFLYTTGGQYDLALTYAEKLETEYAEDSNFCKGAYLKLAATYKMGSMQTHDAGFEHGIDACVKAKEPVWANLARTFIANLDIDQNRTAAAIKLLMDNYDDVQHTSYRRLTSEFDSILARAYWKQGDAERARQYAQSAVEKAVENEITKPLADAYEILYEVAKRQGEYEKALVYHEKFAAADKGYLNDISARTLAFQMVNQQVQDKKRQIDALNDKNQVLQLKQQVDAKSAETDRLYILLLIAVLGSIALWAWKTKRSQLRFMKLARRDGLTGIFSRQHFFEAALASLKYCGKSAREACVVVIDLDNFKAVNDSYGHAAGDLVLKRAVSICQSHLRSIDIFGRLGGEEFGIVLPDCTLESARQRAEELRAAIVGLCSGEDGIDFPVSASFGVAGTRASGYNLRQLLIDADGALYQAKREGRNRVAVFHAVATDSATAG